MERTPGRKTHARLVWDFGSFRAFSRVRSQMSPSSTLEPSAGAPTRQRSFDLPYGLRVETIADQARLAAMMIMGSVRENWGKAELAGWLVGPYARATEVARWASTPGTLPPKPP